MAGASGIQPYPGTPQAAPYDLSTPGEPEAYRVPVAYRRPYGEVTRDKRGRAYFTAFMSVMCAAAAYMTVLLAGGLALLAMIPAVTALVLGIVALRQKSAGQRTQFTGRTNVMAWGGIIAGALCIPLAIGLLLVTSWFMRVAEQANCEVLYSGHEEAIAECVAENS